MTILMLALVLLIAPTAHAGLPCDANSDLTVTIDELVAGVNVALANPLAACHVGCAGACWSPIPSDPPCPCAIVEDCVEFPEANGVHCATSICATDTSGKSQVAACVSALDAATEGVCVMVPP